MRKNLVCSFDLIPGLVIDFLGMPAIVMSNSRGCDEEVAALVLNTAQGDVSVSIPWNMENTISVIGVTVDLEPDNIVLFDS